MAQYTTISGQTLYDLSIQLYGNSSNAVRILKDNPDLLGVAKLIPPGTVIEYTPPEGFTVATYFRNRRTPVVTGTNNPLQGSGFDLGFTLNGFN